MLKKIVNVFPSRITIEGFSDDNRTVIHAHLHTDISLKGNDMLSLNLTTEQVKSLHEELSRHLESIHKS